MKSSLTRRQKVAIKLIVDKRFYERHLASGIYLNTELVKALLDTIKEALTIVDHDAKMRAMAAQSDSQRNSDVQP